MMRSSSDRHQRTHRLIGAAVILMAVAIMAALAAMEERDRRLRGDAEGRALTRPIRIGLQTTSFEDFLTAMRVYHYAAQPSGTASFEDVYYDTEDWTLHDNGYSYRFRTRDRSGSGPHDYSLRLERSREATPLGSKRIEVESELDAPIGSEIAEGAWGAALRPGTDASDRLLTVLPGLGIEPAELAPRLRAELVRDRFDVTDKGTTWFELDHERWRVRHVAPDSRWVSFSDVVLDTRLKRSHPEIKRRVSTMELFASLVDGAVRMEKAPHERAVDALSEASTGSTGSD
jgi:hypothetical protein